MNTEPKTTTTVTIVFRGPTFGDPKRVAREFAEALERAASRPLPPKPQ